MGKSWTRVSASVLSTRADFCPLSVLVWGPRLTNDGCLRPGSSVRQEHFLEVIQNQEFLLLPTAEIVKLLSSDDINVPDEETIFQALMMWVRHDVQNRQQDLGLLLAFIRLPLLPPQVRERAKGDRDNARRRCLKAKLS